MNAFLPLFFMSFAVLSMGIHAGDPKNISLKKKCVFASILSIIAAAISIFFIKWFETFYLNLRYKI